MPIENREVKRQVLLTGIGIISVFLMLSVSSCKRQDGIYMPVACTLPVDADDTGDSILIKAAHVVPAPEQITALQDEFIAFIHFGPNTFTRREWGTGREDPALFDLHTLDTDQWCRNMQAAGMNRVIFTAKHHDGFCLWQSRYTRHGVMSSPYRNGKGDVLKELSASCRKYGIKLGIYLSPADLYQMESPGGLYGNLSEYTLRQIPRPVEGRPFENKTTFRFVVDDYNEYYLNQLFELLTEYGPIHEVWLDGAHPGKKGGQKYTFRAWEALIRTLVPQAVIFGRQDIRWCGNEAGRTRESEWNVIPYSTDPTRLDRFEDITADSVGYRKQLLQARFLHYQPAETNTSIRDGWFYRDDTAQRVRTAEEVFDIYERAVGGNSIFLLNIPPNRQGRFSGRDVAVLETVGKRIRETYGKNLLEGARGPREILDGDLSTRVLAKAANRQLVITTPEPVTINRFVIQESVTTHSERIEAHALDAWVNGEWKEIAAGINVGYKRILRFRPVTSNRFRIRILQSRLEPAISEVSAHFDKLSDGLPSE